MVIKKKHRYSSTRISKERQGNEDYWGWFESQDSQQVQQQQKTYRSCLPWNKRNQTNSTNLLSSVKADFRENYDRKQSLFSERLIRLQAKKRTVWEGTCCWRREAFSVVIKMVTDACNLKLPDADGKHSLLNSRLWHLIISATEILIL